MINTAEVMLWGTRIGIIHMNEANGVVAFEYDKDFLKSNIEVSPIPVSYTHLTLPTKLEV